jgi:hypothetical protein
METWYASGMINRLMFLYFIQAKEFLNRRPALPAQQTEGKPGKRKGRLLPGLPLPALLPRLRAQKGRADDGRE